jgi:hypothetical protein
LVPPAGLKTQRLRSQVCAICFSPARPLDFEKTLAGLPLPLEISAFSHADFNHVKWWNIENGPIALNNDYVKLGFYLFEYQ